MKSRRTPIRWMLGITALTLLLACSPADKSVQPSLGNLPEAIQEEEEKPTVVPTPTLECVYFPADQGTPTCFVSPTPRPRTYGNIKGEARWAAQEAQEEGATRAATDKMLSVKVIQDELVEGSHETIKNWLDERGVSYNEREFTFGVFISAIQLGPLSELEAVLSIWTPEEPAPFYDDLRQSGN